MKARYAVIAGSRFISAGAEAKVAQLLREYRERGYIIVVGDNPKGVDALVARECFNQHYPVLMVGITDTPRNAECAHIPVFIGNKFSEFWGRGQAQYYHRAATEAWMHPKYRYQARDRWMIDLATEGSFIWNGKSPGTKAGYDYMVSLGKTAELITI